MAMLNASEDLEFNKEKEGTHHFHITTQNMPGPARPAQQIALVFKCSPINYN